MPSTYFFSPLPSGDWYNCSAYHPGGHPCEIVKFSTRQSWTEAVWGWLKDSKIVFLGFEHFQSLWYSIASNYQQEQLLILKNFVLPCHQVLGDAKVSHRPELSDLWFGPWSKKEHDGVSALESCEKKVWPDIGACVKGSLFIGLGKPSFFEFHCVKKGCVEVFRFF